MTFSTKPTPFIYIFFCFSLVLATGLFDTVLAQNIGNQKKGILAKGDSILSATQKKIISTAKKKVKDKKTAKVSKADSLIAVKDSIITKTGKAPAFRPKDRYSNRFIERNLQTPILLKDSKKLKNSYSVDADKKEIVISEKLDKSLDYRPIQSLTLEEYNSLQNRYARKSILRDYENLQNGISATSGRGLSPLLEKGSTLDRIFGGDFISAKPNGFILLDFLFTHSFQDNPAINPYSLRTRNDFRFNQQINTNLNTQIGQKVGFLFNFDTKAAFNFDNKLKLNFKNQPEDLLQSIEAGNVSFPLSTQLIPGVQNLFGIKAKMRFGKLDVAVVASQQRSRTESIRLTGGTQGRAFEIRCDNYDENRHFFLGQFFRENYEKSLKYLPQITTDVRITRVEVYVTNSTGTTETMRNVAGVTALGDGTTNQDFVDNKEGKNNTIYTDLNGNPTFRNVNNAANFLKRYKGGLIDGIDYEVLRGAKRLSSTEFKFHPQLGYVSLLTPLRNNEILAVAYEYTYKGKNYKVGELVDDYSSRGPDEVIMLKLLKSSSIRNYIADAAPNAIKMWNLMMKNVYSLGTSTSQINKQGFQLRVIYKDDATGIDAPSIQEGEKIKKVPLISVLGLDNLNSQNDRQQTNDGNLGDGNFDFVEDITVDTKLGRIFFPVLEPFGTYLNSKFTATDKANGLDSKYVFNELYTKTLSDAQQITTKNKFFLKGTVQSSNAAEVQLPLGVSAQSIKVFAGGQQLMEGSDYMVEPQLGRVRITNQQVLSSAREIRIDFERPDLFNTQIRTMLGTRLDYNFSQNLHLGATIMSLRETPAGSLTRVAIGNEPVNNLIFGTDVQYRKDAPWLTRALDKMGMQTKAPSAVQVSGEYAKLIPGVSNKVSGNAMMDDFENARTTTDLTTQSNKWRLGSTPLEFKGLNTTTIDNINGSSESYEYNFKRAKISVYTVDPLLFGVGIANVVIPDGIDPNTTNAYERPFSPQDIFPGRSIPIAGTNLPSTIMDLAYFPEERGMYNYNPDLDIDGHLKQETLQNNFGSVTRGITTDSDFDNANVSYLDLIILDPFKDVVNDGVKNQKNTKGGKLLIHLGDVSEDVIPNSRFDFENGLQAGSITAENDNTLWGFSPHGQFIVDAFDNQDGSRAKQDIGLDGLNDAQERDFSGISDFLFKISGKVGGTALDNIKKDPSADNYEYYSAYQGRKGLIERYKNYLGMENNSPNTKDLTATTNTTTQYTASNSLTPDKEDINADNTINTKEDYYEYGLDLRPNTINQNKFLVEKVESSGGYTWYHFRIPVRDSLNYRKVGSVNGFKAIRFMRMVTTDFSEPVVLRFAAMRLISDQYRTYADPITSGVFGEIPEPDGDTDFKVGVVNIEENGCNDNGNCANKNGSTPYVVPPGFVRDRDFTQQTLVQFNEQSLSLNVSKLHNGASRAVFKNGKFDLINYKRLRMFIHMENATNESGKAGAFVRLGTDLSQNYYEIEVSQLKATPNGTSFSNPEAIWPTENSIDVVISDLISAKGERDRLGLALTSPYQIIKTYKAGEEINGIVNDADRVYKITVIGRPDLSSVQTIMLGVRNPKAEGKEAINFTVWFDELRTYGFDQHGGWAGIGTANFKLADFGTVSLTGAYRGFGFGAVQDRISDRARETTVSYGITANLQLDRLLPEKWGLKIPFFVTFDKQKISPHYNPFDPDTPMDSIAKNDPVRYEKLKKLVTDETTRRGFNFSNVRKIRTNKEGKSQLWSPENFTISYAQNKISRTSFLIDEYTVNQYRGGITYQFAPKHDAWEPFKKNKSLERPWLYWVKDMNFNFMPTTIGFQTGFDRSYTKTQLRSSDGTSTGEVSTDGVSPMFEKYFLTYRRSDLQWNLTKSLVLSYNSQLRGVIDEPYGDVDAYGGTRKTVFENLGKILQGGRAKSYDQKITATWRLPLDKFFLLDWVQADARYVGGVQYTAGTLNLKDENNLSFGNIISNNREYGVQGKVDLVKLYNKLKYLKFANSPSPEKKRQTRNPGDEEEIETRSNEVLKTFTRVLMTVRGINFNYNILETTILPGFLPSPTYAGLDFKGQDNLGNSFAAGAPYLPFILGKQNYANKEGGISTYNFAHYAHDRGWLTASKEQVQPFTQTRTKRFDFSINIEPFKDFRMQITGKYNRGDNYQEYYRMDDDGTGFKTQSAVRTGTFSMTYWSLKTAFSRTQSSGTYKSAIFDKMLNYRSEILNALNTKANEVTDATTNASKLGKYDINSQDVLIPAFFAAYSGKKPVVGKSPFLSIPMPNWRIDYSGLASLEPFKRIFSSITLAHSYTSTYSVGSFTSSLAYGSTEATINLLNLTSKGYYLGMNSGANKDKIVNENGFYIPVFVMSVVSMEEKFSPLLGIQFSLKEKTKKGEKSGVLSRLEGNSKDGTSPTRSTISGQLEYGQSRNIALDLASLNLAEKTTWNMGGTMNFKQNNLKLPFRNADGKVITLKNDLTFRLTINFTDSKDILRQIGDSPTPLNFTDTNLQAYQATVPKGESRVFSFVIGTQYEVNKAVSLSFTLDKNTRTPYTSRTFITSTTTAKLQVRLNLAEL